MDLKLKAGPRERRCDERGRRDVHSDRSEEDSKANKNQILVTVDENSEDRCARATGGRGVGSKREMDWRVKDTSAELKRVGYRGGGEHALDMKSDGERSIMALGES